MWDRRTASLPRMRILPGRLSHELPELQVDLDGPAGLPQRILYLRTCPAVTPPNGRRHGPSRGRRAAAAPSGPPWLWQPTAQGGTVGFDLAGALAMA